MTDIVNVPSDVPVLADDQGRRVLSNGADPVGALPVLRGSADPEPSRFPVDLSQAPRDVQTGASVADVMKTTGVPPQRQKVDIEPSGGPSYLQR
jgi:hypothetical protein